jgi:hypothetical protein
MAVVSFIVPRYAHRHIETVLNRAEALGAIRDEAQRLSVQMDIAATHANGTPIRFRAFAEADDFNLLHDLVGIARHIDRRTGRLGGQFLPRCARLGV